MPLNISFTDDSTGVKQLGSEFLDGSRRLWEASLSIVSL